MQKLWNKNFSILSIGSFISALGSAVAGISFGILIYLETRSPLLLAAFTITSIVPRVIANFVVGPFVDRHSRVKMIYILDFFYAVFFAGISLVLFTGYFDVVVFMIVAAFLGVTDTVYQTAFMSLFPETVPQGKHTKAYSIASLIWPISAALMAPIATFFIQSFEFGVALLMAFNALTFLITATMETLMKVEEKLNQNPVVRFQFVTDLKEGIAYVKKERGILGIGILFMAFSFVYAASDLLRMPFFEESSIYNLNHFAFLISAGSLGRIVGGAIHYIFKLNLNHKFKIAIIVYFTVEILDAILLFTPFFMMVTFSFIVGVLSVTSFNIRMSATQTYIPSDKRGRVNSVQSLLWNVGAIVGTLIFGLIAEFTKIEYQFLILGSAIVSITAIFLVPLRMREEFKKIYNVDV